MTYTCCQSNIVSSKTYTYSQLLHSPPYPTMFANIISYFTEYLIYKGNCI